MTISIDPLSTKNLMNLANVSQVFQAFQNIQLGNVVRALHTRLTQKAPVASSYNLSTLKTIVLADDAKASTISRAYARTKSGAGTLGELAVQAYGATPADGQIAVAPNGDIVVDAGTATYTSVDVEYLPMKYDVFEMVVPQASDSTDLSAVCPAQFKQGVIALLEAEVITGTTPGKKVILVPGSAPGTAQQMNLDLAKKTLQAHAGDGATSVRIKLALCCAVDVDAILTATAKSP